jgi:hypothetical protein
MTNRQKSEKLRKFLEQRPAISISGLEREANLPGQTLAWVKKGRELPEHHWPDLEKALKKYCWK